MLAVLQRSERSARPEGPDRPEGPVRIFSVDYLSIIQSTDLWATERIKGLVIALHCAMILGVSIRAFWDSTRAF